MNTKYLAYGWPFVQKEEKKKKNNFEIIKYKLTCNDGIEHGHWNKGSVGEMV